MHGDDGSDGDHDTILLALMRMKSNDNVHNSHKITLDCPVK